MAGTLKDPEKGSVEKLVTWPQWLAACMLSLAVLVSGLANGWASPYMARLTQSEAEIGIKLTDGEASWVASLLNLGRLLGALLGALFQEFVGRKKVLLLGGLPLAASWVFDVCASSVPWVYASRFSSGVGSGMIWPALSLYLGEIADPRIRGSLISMNVNLASVGLVLGNAMGPYLSMEVYGYVSLIPTILFLILFTFIPESPYYYVLQGDIDQAEKSLRWFRRRSDVKAELAELQEFVQGAGVSIFRKTKEFLLPGNFSKALIIIGTYGFSYASGYSTLSSYAEIVVTKTKIGLTASTLVTALGVSTIAAGFTATLVVDRLGRKSLLIISSFGAAVSLGLLGLHFHLLSVDVEPTQLTWLPIASLLGFNLSVAYGLVPVPNALLGEMFPADLKNIASLLISTMNALMSFTCARTYQPFLDMVGDKFVYWTYAVIVLLCVPYVHYLIPETKGKSLLEIQRTMK